RPLSDQCLDALCLNESAVVIPIVIQREFEDVIRFQPVSNQPLFKPRLRDNGRHRRGKPNLLSRTNTADGFDEDRLRELLIEMGIIEFNGLKALSVLLECLEYDFADTALDWNQHATRDIPLLAAPDDLVLNSKKEPALGRIQLLPKRVGDLFNRRRRVPADTRDRNFLKRMPARGVPDCLNSQTMALTRSITSERPSKPLGALVESSGLRERPILAKRRLVVSPFRCAFIRLEPCFENMLPRQQVSPLAEIILVAEIGRLSCSRFLDSAR